MPLLEGIHAATSMLRADAAGYEYMLLRQEQGWLTRTTTPGSTPTRREWTDEGALLRTWTEARDVGYHPHVRPWYEGGVGLREQARQARRHGAPHPVYWTKPYKFFTTEELGISVSTPVTGAGGREFVIAFDLKLGDLSTHTRELPVGIDQGQVFVLDDEDRVLGLPKETRPLEPEALLLEPITKLADAPISRTAVLEWQRRDRTTEPFLLELGPPQRYWVGFRRVDAPDRPKMWIGVVVPESHFLADGD
jgi:hypothetical protein